MKIFLNRNEQKIKQSHLEDLGYGDFVMSIRPFEKMRRARSYLRDWS
jgi:hypothetical protein